MSWEQQPQYDGGQGGWTPQFAEDYSVFNDTPGRLINGHRAFVDTSTVQALSPMGHNGQFNGEGNMVTDLGIQMHQLPPNATLQMSSVMPQSNKQVDNSPVPQSPSRARFNDVMKTPQKQKKSLDEPFGSQTATPPNSSRGNRKLAPKVSPMPKRAQAQDNGFGTSNAGSSNVQPQLMIHPSTTIDPFAYPMSAPASAPVFTNNKLLWDTSVDGMDIDFSTHSPEMFQNHGHRISNSIDWGKSNQIFQETMNLPPSKPIEAEPRKRQRPLASKSSLPATTATEIHTSLQSFAFSSAPASSAPLAAESFIGAVDPGLIYSRPNSGSGSQADFEDIMLPTSRPATGYTTLAYKPYEHQLREYSRDQEELRRSRSFRESSAAHRGSVSSPVKGSAQPGLRRSASDSRDRRNKDRSRIGSGRISPVKQLRLPNLTSIPESPLVRPRTRPEVKLAVGANGRATVVVDDEPERIVSRRSSYADYDDSYYESSTDEEPILVLSRNNSFDLPKLNRHDSSREFRRRSTSASSYSQSSTSQHTSIDELSEAETVMDENKAGDAASALRKVVRDRRKSQQLSQTGRNHRVYSDATPRAGRYTDYGSSSTRSLTDPDGATPSSSRSGSTRCVCNSVDGDPFMIQCESCDNWLHGQCVNIDRRSLPPVYICAFCAQTPNMRGGRMRETALQREKRHLPSSPLDHKSFRGFR
ncbi:phd-finger domain-containing protein [Rutstroemia sp. NJR-2017a WRK4]|nr:phd-finger domain-containing protein [Rutstroemia sp. NJR-2017a WRK4]